MNEASLSDKKHEIWNRVDGSDMTYAYEEKSVKEKVQNAERRLNLKISIEKKNTIRTKGTKGLGYKQANFRLKFLDNLIKEINKIFKEEFGDKLR